MTFFGTFLKNVARIECATYYERLYNAYIQFAKNFPKMPKFSWVISRSSRPKVFFKRDVLENFAKSTRNPKYRSLFLIKLQSSIPQHQKRNCSTEIFPWVLRNFQEQLRAAACFFVISREVSQFFNPIQDRHFRGCLRMGGAKSPRSLKSFTHILQWWNLGQL